MTQLQGMQQQVSSQARQEQHSHAQGMKAVKHTLCVTSGSFQGHDETVFMRTLRSAMSGPSHAVFVNCAK